MNRKSTLYAVITFLFALSLFSVCFGQLSTGVKKGDWIEYDVTYTGSPVGGHDMNWARMEVLGVQGDNISVLITSRFSNGTEEILTYTLNLKSGQLIDDFIVPANLKAGDSFYDQNWGNITIVKTEQRTYAGATRTVAIGYAQDNTYVWDQATGVSVEGNASTPTFTIHSVISATSMWQPTGKSALTPMLVAIVVALPAAAAIAGMFIYLKRQGERQAGASD